MKITRRHILTGTTMALGGTALRSPARAAQFTYKYGNPWPANHPISVRMQQAAGKILQASNGQLQIRVFPAATPGTNSGMFSQTRAGAIEFVDLAYNVAETAAPIAGLGTLPFTFTDQKNAIDAMDGPLGRTIRAAISKLSLYVFQAAWDGGFLSNHQ